MRKSATVRLGPLRVEFGPFRLALGPLQTGPIVPGQPVKVRLAPLSTVVPGTNNKKTRANAKG